MRAQQQNMRQRAKQGQQGNSSERTPTRVRGGLGIAATPSSWEITSDDGYDSTSSGNRLGGGGGGVPMFNPLHVSSDNEERRTNSIRSSPGSFPLSWQHDEISKHSLAQGKIRPAPSSLEGLRSSQLPSLTPAIIPDSNYQAYLLGVRSKKKRTSFVDKICFAKFCALFSSIAIMFLVFIGILIDTQPMFIQGVLPKHEQYEDGNGKKQVFYDLSQSERLPTASRAYQAAFFYFLTGCLSLAYAYNFQWWLKSRLGQYHDIPDADSTVPNFHSHHHHQDGVELPTFHPTMTAYQYNNGLSARIWKATGLAMHRVGMYLASPHKKRKKRRKQSGAKDV